MVQPVAQLHVNHVNSDVVFLMLLYLSMFPTKLYSFYLLTYVLDLCQLLSFIMAPYMVFFSESLQPDSSTRRQLKAVTERAMLPNP